MTPEQTMRLVERLNADPEMRALLNAPPADCPDGAAAAGVGVPYILAGMPVPPPTPCHLWALSLIRSPLLVPGAEVEAADAWRALYAMTSQPDGLACIAGVDAALEHIRRLSGQWGVDNAGLATAAAATVQRAYAELDRRVGLMVSRYPGVTGQDVADLIDRMLSDIRTAWARVPAGDSEGTPARPFAETGSAPRASTLVSVDWDPTYGGYPQPA